jgi:drug/metabolite transporter (DMT)-like permease
MDYKLIGIVIACVLLFSYIGFLEKKVVGKHHCVHFSLSRVFYMLLIIVALILVYDPAVLSSKAFLDSVTDPHVALVGVITALAMLLYYWILTHKALYITTMMWPVITLLTVVFACMFAGERLSVIQWSGVLLSTVGVFLVLYKHS